MYLSSDMIRSAIPRLRRIHPFFGITFLVCKKAMLPVGDTVSIQINTDEESFLNEHYKPDIRSRHYFHPYKTSGQKGGWLSKRYASTGSQKTRTQSHLAKAFIHERSTDKWGWQEDYVNVLREQLARDRIGAVPAFWLGVWLYRSKRWPQQTTAAQVVSNLLKEYSITDEEKRLLFDVSVPSDLPLRPFQPDPCDAREILEILPPAPDAEPQRGGTLRLLELRAIGPASRLSFEPADRLTIITGDNGLGKTFFLECAWWSLTGMWAETTAAPRPDARVKGPSITFQISGKSSSASRKTTISYDWENQTWPFPRNRPTIPGLIVYARVDGSFAVWDPARHVSKNSFAQRSPAALVLKREQVIDGLQGQIEGLIRDWVNWQRAPNQRVFEILKRALHRLSPPEAPALEPAEPIRVLGDPREMPTIRHTYGDIPFINESAGVRRIMTLAYLLVWAWSEHEVSANLARRAPEKKIVVLIDEMEAHLHPKWQRAILPAILDLSAILGDNLNAQIILTTQSPLVLASAEHTFDETCDKLYHLDLSNEGEVKFGEFPFFLRGSVDEWLKSEIFELRQATSIEAEKAIESAKVLLAQANPSADELRKVTEALRVSLPSDDILWARWAYFLSRKGIEI